MACRCISSVVITQSLLPRQINAYDGRAEVHRESFDYRGPRDNERGGVVVGSRPSGADIITAHLDINFQFSHPQSRLSMH